MQRAVRVADVPSRPGKVRNAVLPQEYNMFRLLSNASFAEESWTEKTPACVWKHVECNNEGEVTKIQWTRYERVYVCVQEEERVSLKGSLRWNFLPDTLISFDASLQEVLEGHVDLAVLPAGLKKFDIRSKHTLYPPIPSPWNPRDPPPGSSELHSRKNAKYCMPLVSFGT